MRYLIVMLAVALCGCGTATSVQTSGGELPKRLKQAPSFDFKDVRPLPETMSRRESSPNGTTVFLGDNSLDPSGPHLVMAALQQAMYKELTGKTVRLDEFTAYVYDPAATVDSNGSPAARWPSALGQGFFPVEGLMMTGMSSLVSEKTVRIVIKGAINGAEFSSNTADKYRGRIDDDRVRSTLAKALEEMVSNVRGVVDSK